MSVLTRGRDVNPRAATPNTPRRKARYLLLRNQAGQAFVQFPDLSRQARREGLSGAWLMPRVRDAWPSTAGTVVAVQTEWAAARLDWDHRPPVRAATVNYTSGAVAAGQWFSIDVLNLVRQIANGTKDYGFRVGVDVNADRWLHAFDTDDEDGAWKLVLEFDQPDDPPDVAPDGGVVSTSKWTVELTDLPGRGRDDDDTTGVTGIHVQVDPAGNGAAPAFDSGQVSVDVPELRLADTAYPGLAEAAVTRQRARARVSGRWTDWSDWSDDIAFRALITATLTSPALDGDGVGRLTDSSPIVELTASAPILRYRMRVTPRGDRSKVLFDSEEVRLAGGPTSLSVRIPEKQNGRRILSKDRENYWLNVRLWDRSDRVTTGGAKAYRDYWFEITFVDGPNPAPKGVSAAQVGLTPMVRLRWSRDSAADEWVIIRDGVRVARVPHSAVTRLKDGSGWTWVDRTASQFRRHEYQIRALEVSGGKTTQSKASNVSDSASVEPHAEGTWLIRPNGDTVVFHAEDPLGQLAPTQRRAVYSPPGLSHDIAVITAPSSLQGPVECWLNPHDDTGQTLEHGLAVCDAIAANPRQTVQFVSGTTSIPVRVWDLVALADGQMLTEDAWHRVPFTVQEVTGDLNGDDG